MRVPHHGAPTERPSVSVVLLVPLLLARQLGATVSALLTGVAHVVAGDAPDVLPLGSGAGRARLVGGVGVLDTARRTRQRLGVVGLHVFLVGPRVCAHADA